MAAFFFAMRRLVHLPMRPASNIATNIPIITRPATRIEEVPPFDELEGVTSDTKVSSAALECGARRE